MLVPSASGSWRIDRRTFLKLLGIGGAGLLASGSIGTLLSPLTATRVAAATGPVDDLALALEFDTERIFRFVSERIRYEPYAGVLRGAEGTLMARAGNSADQAVLLAALLKASGVETRFVEAPLDPIEADALLAHAAIDATTAREEFVDALTGVADGGRPLIVPQVDAATRARLEEAQQQAETVVTWAKTRLGDTASMIETALAQAGIVLPASHSPLPSPERDRHLWVQMALGQTWLDLDPTLPGARPGDVVTTATLDHDEVPDDLRHWLKVAVVSEVMSGGSLQEEVLLELEESADVLAGLPIGILNIELESLKAIGVGIASALEGGTTYRPCLVVGEDVLVGPGVIRFGGDPAADPFDALAVGSPSPGDGEPTAEWVRVTLISPGAEPVVVEREIFDRVGPAARSAGPPELTSLPPVQLVQLEPDGPPDYLPAQRSHWLTVHTGTFGGQALGDALARREVEDAFTNVVHGFQIAREACALETGLEVGTRTFAASPNLAAMTVEFEQGEDGALNTRAGLDIWHRDLGTAAVDGIAKQMSPSLIAGILPHIAERLMFGEAHASGDEERALVSVGLIFEAARARGIGIRALTSTDDVDALPYPADATARLRAALGDGRVAVVPEASALFGDEERVGWWLIDPRTGRAVDEMDDGRGSGAEYTNIVIAEFRAMPLYKRSALCIAFIAELTSSLIYATQGLGAAFGSGEMRRQALGGIAATLSLPNAAAAGGFAYYCVVA